MPSAVSPCCSAWFPARCQTARSADRRTRKRAPQLRRAEHAVSSRLESAESEAAEGDAFEAQHLVAERRQESPDLAVSALLELDYEVRLPAAGFAELRAGAAQALTAVDDPRLEAPPRVLLDPARDGGAGCDDRARGDASGPESRRRPLRRPRVNRPLGVVQVELRRIGDEIEIRLPEAVHRADVAPISRTAVLAKRVRRESIGAHEQRQHAALDKALASAGGPHGERCRSPWACRPCRRCP